MRPKYTKFLIAFLFASYCLSGIAFAAGKGMVEIITTEGPVRFSVEYAISPEEKAKGLMYRKSLPKQSGMLFVYQKPKSVTMWMKNTYISLDMFFINRKGRIRYIEKNTQPHSTRQINSGGRVSAVLELVGGSADDFGIQVGDQVNLLN